MADLLKISFIFAVIVLLLRKKLNVGLAMLIAASALLVLYRMPFPSIVGTAKSAVLNEVTIKLLLALSFIRMFEMILREHNVLAEMTQAAKSIFRKKKLVAVSMPLLIGLMPSIGGAYFSAPMVDETTRGVKMSQEEKSFINYWFRHPWEYILPLYPGILLASAISGIELHALIALNLAYAAVMVISGFVFSLRGLKGTAAGGERLPWKKLWSFAPILTVLLLVVMFRVELHYALIAVTVFLLAFYRYDLKSVARSLKHGFAPDVIYLIIGVMFFKEVLENSGAVKNLSGFFLHEGIPAYPIYFLLPFITGMLTGITVGFVGSTFPLIISIAGSAPAGVISFAFASGFLGVLLSPVHICLILTREYFKADLWGIYKMMLPGCMVVFAAAALLYMLLP